jgi:hypothetical protein
MADLSILVPSRNEMFLSRTIEDILANIEGDTEVLVVADGCWPDPPVADHPRVNMIHFTESVGQRAATNYAARLSRAKYIMKCDAHCAFDKGFDIKLMKTFEYDWTVILRMYNLHAFDWVCKKCGDRTYQGPTPSVCPKCQGLIFERDIVWKPRLNRRTDFARFDSDLHFQYHSQYEKRPESKGDIADVMCHVGACWAMHRERYWELGGMDENVGSWGQMGVEVSCKTWLSGGRQVVNKTTWFGHMFRTSGGDFGFPYPLSGRAVDHARKVSKDTWFNNKFEKQIHPLSWMLEKFWPIPGWTDEDLLRVQKVGANFPGIQNKVLWEETVTPVSAVLEPVASEAIGKTLTKGAVYYTDNRIDPVIMDVVQKQIKKSCNGTSITSVSLAPIDFGKNIVLNQERGVLSMFRQILAGIEATDTDIIFLIEHDVLYHKSHFDFVPPKKDVVYFNENTWRVDSKTGQALFYYCKQVSGVCAYRDVLLEHYRKRVERVEREGYDRSMGYEPGAHPFPRGVDNLISETWWSDQPNVDIRHGCNLTKSRWSQDQFRNKDTCKGWKMADEIPHWGVTKGRFQEFLKEIQT